MILPSLPFILFCVRKMILCQIVVRMSKRRFLLMTLCTSLTRRTSSPMWILIVVLLSCLQFLQKLDRSTENGITFPDPVKNPSAFPTTINNSVLMMISIALNIFLTPYILWDISPAALTSLKHNNDRYSISNQYPQPTTQQPRTDSYPVLFSLRTMNSKRKGLRLSFAFLQINYLPDGRVNETVATVEKLSDLWKPGAMDGIQPFVMNCICI